MKTQKEMALEVAALLEDCIDGEDVVTFLDILDALACAGLILAPMPEDANPAADAYVQEVKGMIARSAPNNGTNAP